MHAEILRNDDQKAKQPWRWHFVSKGRITANNETFPSKANALRAVKGVVKAVVKELIPPAVVVFSLTENDDGVFILRWE